MTVHIYAESQVYHFTSTCIYELYMYIVLNVLVWLLTYALTD